MEEYGKILNLSNGQGEFLPFVLRKYRWGDEEDMIACIRDEYGESYFKKELYDGDYIKKKAEEGSMLFLVAKTLSGETAGMMLLKQLYPEENMCELASQILKKKYRGYGLSMPFAKYGMEILSAGSYYAAYSLPVLFHDISQRHVYELGLRATGFILNVFDLERISHSFENGRNEKHSQGIQVKAVKKENAGTVYIPGEHQAFCRAVYGRLGVRYKLAKEKKGIGKDLPEGLPEKSMVTYKNDGAQSSLEISICAVGGDLKKRLTEIYEKYPLTGKQTANVFLNCSDRCSVYAYRILEEEGWFFTGLKPLCSDREFLVMHHKGDVEIYFDDYVVSREFKPLLEYVKKCCEGRKDGRLWQKRKDGSVRK